MDSRIEPSEEARILAELKQKTEIIYGSGTFEAVERDVKKNVEAERLLRR